MARKAQYNGTEDSDGADTKMLKAFFFSDIGGESRTIMAASQEEANEHAGKLLEDMKAAKEVRDAQ
jgi:hypothetical protein